ncbi:hypothetical protein OE810_04895 [Rhodobacteraceae bacterium XHP0102]|nr:hypothetical protein [Rhodobacteraceae bacterium XHP0102]
MSSASNNNSALKRLRKLVLVEVPPALERRLPRLVIDAADDVIAANLDSVPQILTSDPPEMVVSPLISGRFDAIELAVALRKAAFRGKLVVVCDKLPDPALIRQELENQASGFSVSLLVLGQQDKPIAL